jgi:hypothetical protein
MSPLWIPSQTRHVVDSKRNSSAILVFGILNDTIRLTVSEDAVGKPRNTGAALGTVLSS